MDSDLINKKLKFLDEIEKFSCIKRKILKSNGECESDSDHSWFLAMFVMIFKDEILNSNSNLDYTRMLEMCLIHDLPEVYAGDVFPFGEGFNKVAKEKSDKYAADELFNLLDEPLKSKFINLYKEYSEIKSPEAEVVKALDKIQPDHLNVLLKGENWKFHNITFTKLFDYKDKYISKNVFTKSLYYDFIIKKGLDEGFLKK